MPCAREERDLHIFFPRHLRNEERKRIRGLFLFLMIIIMHHFTITMSPVMLLSSPVSSSSLFLLLSLRSLSVSLSSLFNIVLTSTINTWATYSVFLLLLLRRRLFFLLLHQNRFQWSLFSFSWNKLMLLLPHCHHHHHRLIVLAKTSDIASLLFQFVSWLFIVHRWNSSMSLTHTEATTKQKLERRERRKNSTSWQIRVFRSEFCFTIVMIMIVVVLLVL